MKGPSDHTERAQALTGREKPTPLTEGRIDRHSLNDSIRVGLQSNRSCDDEPISGEPNEASEFFVDL